MNWIFSSGYWVNVLFFIRNEVLENREKHTQEVYNIHTQRHGNTDAPPCVVRLHDDVVL